MRLMRKRSIRRGRAEQEELDQQGLQLSVVRYAFCGIGFPACSRSACF